MKLLKTILLIALHGAHASHKVTKNALDAETTHRLTAEAATAGVVKLPGAVAKLFGQAEGTEVRADQTQGAMGQHQEKFEGSPAPGKLGIYYLSVEGPPAEFVLVDTKSGKEHVIPIEAGTHITYDNTAYEHRVDAHPDSKRTMLGPVSRLEPRRRLETGNVECTPCCTGGEENCEAPVCPYTCFDCGYTGLANKPEKYGDCPNYRRRLRAAAGRKTLFGSSEPDVTLADGCC